MNIIASQKPGPSSIVTIVYGGFQTRARVRMEHPQFFLVEFLDNFDPLRVRCGQIEMVPRRIVKRWL